MSISAAEQYLLELINRARLDPASEAARYGIGLNDGLAAGTISSAAKQVLAPNVKLEAAATAHSLWMLDHDVFSHDETVGGSTLNPGARITAQGYIFSAWAENLAYVASTGAVTMEGSIDALHKNLFLSEGHRLNMTGATYREVGVGAELGVFTSGRNYNAAMLTEDFGMTGTARFVTGVAYTDRNADNFYSMGEGKSGVSFTVGAASAMTAAAGGYGVSTGSKVATVVTGVSGALTFQAVVDMSHGNVKLDLVNDSKILTSGNITLVSGIRNADLLGVGDLNAIGNAGGNVLNGNSGNNMLTGGAGADVMSGFAGNDTILGGAAHDVITGGSGNDVLSGALGSDTFVFGVGFGRDSITDFSLAQTDHLSLSHSLWSGTKSAAAVVTQFAHIGTGEVYLDFGGGNEIHLAGLTTLTGLDSSLVIV